MTYKGAIIEPAIYGGYEWYHPDFLDVDWDGDERNQTGCGSGNSVEECKEEIDEFLSEKT